MKNTTLCYIEKEDSYLMLHRVKKVNDENQDKWIGVGGKIEEGESPEDCLLREVKEETGLTLTQYRYRGLVTFVSNQWGTEYMHLFTADGYEGALHRKGRAARAAEEDPRYGHRKAARGVCKRSGGGLRVRGYDARKSFDLRLSAADRSLRRSRRR